MASAPGENDSILKMTPEVFISWMQEREDANLQAAADSVEKNEKDKGDKKTKKAKKLSIRQLLLCKESGLAVLGPDILVLNYNIFLCIYDL